MTIAYVICTMVEQNRSTVEAIIISMILLTMTYVHWWIVVSIETYIDIMTFSEMIMKWWNRRSKVRIKTRWKNTCSRYYVPGNKARMARICWKRGIHPYACVKQVLNKNYEKIMCLASNRRSRLHEDSTWLGVDTLSTYCITNDENDFVGKTQDVSAGITGISGTDSKASITKTGSGVFKILDDLGETCTIPVPGTILL
jgi:hypothetical protein